MQTEGTEQDSPCFSGAGATEARQAPGQGVSEPTAGQSCLHAQMRPFFHRKHKTHWGEIRQQSTKQNTESCGTTERIDDKA